LFKFDVRITWDNVSLRAIFEDHETTIERYGVEKALWFLNRYSDIESASNLADIKIGEFEIVELDDDKVILQYKLNHKGDIAMVFEAKQRKMDKYDHFNFKEITRLKLLKLIG